MTRKEDGKEKKKEGEGGEAVSRNNRTHAHTGESTVSLDGNCTRIASRISDFEVNTLWLCAQRFLAAFMLCGYCSGAVAIQYTVVKSMKLR